MSSSSAPMNTAKTIPERVAAGIALLDSRDAGDAHALARIDTDRLDFFSVHRDVLGQVYGQTAYGLEALGLTTEQAIALGLDCIDGEEDDLTAEWVRQLVARRAAALPRRLPVAEEVAA